MVIDISTHSAREDGDMEGHYIDNHKKYISTHSAREDGDTQSRQPRTSANRFQPTPPARTETIPVLYIYMGLRISTHSAREDGDMKDYNKSEYNRISTHSAREDGDRKKSGSNSTPKISTHSAREDGDKLRIQPHCAYYDFNPLRPRGRRLSYML